MRFSSTNTGDNSSFIDAVVVAAAGVNNPPSVSLVSVATGFSAPVDIANARDSSGRLFVVQQGGQIRIISGGQVLPAPFLDIQSLVLSGGERGLLGVAFHTNYAVNGFFYVNYTAAAPRPVNSGLETPVLPPSSYQYAPTGGTWTFSSGAGIQSNGSAWGAAAAPEGQQTAFLQGIAQMSQTLNLAAGNYTVSFYAARRGGQIQPIQVSIDGTPIGGPITPADNSFAVYTTSAFNLATGGAHTLRFNSTNTGDNSSFVDAVVVVPEEGDGATVIARYQRSAGDPNIADPNSAQILLTVAQPFANHNGGQLRFGADGYLYIGLGDGGSGNDPGDRAQNLNTLLGKMLRIDVNSGSPYAIPEGNPFQNDGNPNTRGEIWAYGLRNPWRFSFDRPTGDLFIADVGQSAREEINFQQAGSGAGANYGWRVMEGSNCTGLGGTGPACFAPSLTPPILEYDHSVGCSVTGGHRYRGAAYPTLTGYFVYGDFCTQRIWGATTSGNGVWSNTQLSVTAFKISTFGEDETGEIYVAGYDTGVIYRVAAQ